MSVYVDDLTRMGWRMYGKFIPSCHMIADSVEELVEFAERIGLHRRWVQGTTNGRTPHYDLTAGKRREAIAAGAVVVDKRKFVEIIQKLRKERRCN